MTTDKQTIKAMFDRAGIVYSEGREDQFLRHETDADEDVVDKLVVDQAAGPNNIGYNGFFAELFFSKKDGRLLAVGAWE